jgi:AraC-like DNA-binding protein
MFDTDLLPYSHAKYLENDSIKYELKTNELILSNDQKTHFHDDIELLFVTAGNAELLVNGETNFISPGDLIMLMPYHVHSIKLKSTQLKLFQCHVSLSLLLFSSISRTAERYISYSLAYGNVVAKFCNSEEKRIHDSFMELLEESKSESTLNTMISLSIVIKIILLFNRKITEALSNKSQLDHCLTWKMMQYMNSNFNKDISAKSISKEFSLTPLKVNNYFYLLTGDNFSQNLHRTRMRYACSMMQFEQLSNSFIGKYVGYKSTSAFFRKFKEMKNTTPDEYRKKNISQDLIYKSLNVSWKIVLYLYEHYSEKIDEKTISERLFMSPQTIRTEVLSSFDKTLSELLTMIRIQYACSFLKVLEEPMIKIAYLTGFSSVRTFNRCFKEITGYTPSEYQETYKLSEKSEKAL